MGSEKIVIIFLADWNYNLYIVDPSGSVNPDNGFVERLPTLRLDFRSFQWDAFCVVGSTLFVFEGVTCPGDPVKKSVYTFDLSSTVVDNLEKNSGCRVAEMHGPKTFPRATPTPDGKKIIVFSTIINDSSESPEHVLDDDTCDEILAHVFDFEVYDMDANSWTKIARIHNWRDAPQAFTIDRYSTTFHLSTTIGSYSLDLTAGSSLSQWGSTHNIPFLCRFFVIEEELLCLSCEGAHDISNGYEKSRCFPFSTLSSPPPGNYSLGLGFYICPLGGGGGDFLEDGVCNFWVSQVWADKHTRFPCLIVDVCSIDVTKYREDKKLLGDGAKPETHVHKTFKFIMDDKPCRSLGQIDMLSMYLDWM